MTTEKEVQALVDQFSPHDGFGIQDVVIGNEHSLHLVFRRDGVAVTLPWRTTQAKELWAATNPTAKELGDKARLKLLMTAMCRFVNTGGNGSDMLHFAGLLETYASSATFEISGFHLIDSFIPVGAGDRAEHLFAADNSPYAIRWAEGEFFDVVKLTDVINELNKKEENEPTNTRGGIANQGGDQALLGGPDS